jgi:hypothetical protein
MVRLGTVWMAMLGVWACALVPMPRGLAQDDSPPPAAPLVRSSSPATRSESGLAAGLEAWERGEMARQAAWQQQLVLDDQLRYRLGVPLGRTPLLGAVVPLAPGSSAWPLLPPDDRESRYAYGPPAPDRQVPRRFVFEPWPFIPGDLYGLPVVPTPAIHPIGQQELQTGPRRWESRPVYAGFSRQTEPAASGSKQSMSMDDPANGKRPAISERGASPDRRPKATPSRELDFPSNGSPRPKGPREY